MSEQTLPEVTQVPGMGQSQAAIVSTPGAAAAMAREGAQLKLAAEIAMYSPRNEAESGQRMLESCRRPAFATLAEYSFPRGGKTVRGPSVYLAREAAACWGNVRYGSVIVGEHEGKIHVQGFAWDVQRNVAVVQEDLFEKRIQRRKRLGNGEYETQWVVPDERDLRELINKRAALCVRNAILQVVPSDFIEAACEEARRTQQAAARGELAKDRKTAVRDLTKAFADQGVTVKMLEERLEHALDAIDDVELAELRTIWKSINDGQSRREDYFEVRKRAPEPEETAPKAEEDSK